MLINTERTSKVISLPDSWFSAVKRATQAAVACTAVCGTYQRKAKQYSSEIFSERQKKAPLLGL